jgi:hypothetical protein
MQSRHLENIRFVGEWGNGRRHLCQLVKKNIVLCAPARRNDDVRCRVSALARSHIVANMAPFAICFS